MKIEATLLAGAPDQVEEWPGPNGGRWGTEFDAAS